MSVSPGSPAELEALLQRSGAGSVDDLPAPSPDLQPSLRPAVPRKAPDASSLAELFELFSDRLSEHGIEFDASTRLDLMCALLSSQFVLLAGPSGTGKSTAGAALQGFFAPSDSTSVLDARRQLVGPEDVVGYTALGGQYVRAPGLDSLLRLGGPADPDAASPCLLVEEINLSPAEGYLAPLVHGLSALSGRTVAWPLHHGDPVGAGVPRNLSFSPYLRLIGTINVDSTAAAPSPKVAARACVVLLEPVDSVNMNAAWTALTTKGSGTPWGGGGAPFVHDPGAPVDPAVLGGLKGGLLKAIGEAIELVRRPGAEGTDGMNVVTRRQVAQMIQYGSWFALTADGIAAKGSPGPTEEDRHKWAAENALLHFVLPGLSPEEFTRVLSALGEPGKVSPVADADTFGSVLGSRVARLSASSDESVMTGQVLDFWDRLS